MTSERNELRRELARAERGRRWSAFGLALPLLAFLGVFFFLPIGVMLFKAVDDPVTGELLPRTVEALDGWDGEAIPGEPAFAALADELRQARRDKTLRKLAKRLEHERAGRRALLLRTARALEKTQAATSATFAAIDPAWATPAPWRTIERTGGPLTTTWLLKAVDLDRDAGGEIVAVPDDEGIYLEILGRTFVVSLQVTLVCLLLGYPVAFLLATAPRSWANIGLICVLLPFWTSLLVRTTAWIVLLQREGVVNDVARWLGLIDQPAELVFNRVGVLVAMTHILLPFMVLPLYSVMRGISPDYVRAARSLGAGPFTAFRRVYLPQTLPGVGAGGLLVFILAIGYYITPALVGGPTDQLLSYFVALHTNQTLNWGLAAALGAVLLALTTVFYLVFDRVVGVEKLRVG